jgi:hypothetical protein
VAKLHLTPLGSSGLNRSGGVVHEEYLRELAGQRWRRTLREMIDQDPVIGAVLFAVEMLIRQVEWPVVPASDKPEAMEVAEFVQGCLDDMETTWPDTLAEITSFLAWGWSYMEIVYKLRGGDARDPKRRSKYSDGRVGWRKWGIRSQESLDEWDFDEEGGVRGLWQMPPPDYRRRYIPADKALHFRVTSRKGNPEGRSILRNAYRPWYFLKHIQNIEGIGIERDLAGLPVAHVPAEVLAEPRTAEYQAVYDAIKDVVTNIRRDEQEGVMWPLAYDANGHPLYKLELLSTGGTRQFDTDKIINRYKSEIAMSVLADFILLGHEAVGSFALASSKTSLFSVAIGAWLQSIAAPINDKGIPDLLRLNGIPLDLAPRLVPGDVETVDLTELGNYIKALTGGGVSFDEEEQRWLKSQAGIPINVKAQDEEEGEEQPAPEPSGDAGPAPVDEADASAAEVRKDLALNGAQVTAALDIVNRVAEGTLPRTSAIDALIIFFNLTREDAERVMGEVGKGFRPSRPAPEERNTPAPDTQEAA